MTLSRTFDSAPGRPAGDAPSPSRQWPLPRRPEAEFIPVLYAPRWRWLVVPARRGQPLDLLGVFPCGAPLSPYDAAAMPAPLRHLPPAAIIAALAVLDGLLPPLLPGAGGPPPPPLRVALFGPGAGAVASALRRAGLPLPSDRLLHAFAVRGGVEQGEEALPPGVWPVLCGAHLLRPSDGDGDGAAGPGADPLPGLLRDRASHSGDDAPARLAERLRSLQPPLLAEIAALSSHPYSGAMARLPADATRLQWRLLPAAALSLAPVLPFLSDRLLWLLRSIEAAAEGRLSARIDPYLQDAACGLCWALWGEAIALPTRGCVLAPPRCLSGPLRRSCGGGPPRSAGRRAAPPAPHGTTFAPSAQSAG